MPKITKIVGILIKLPPNMANAGWDIDADRLMQFAKEFGIHRNIEFRFQSGKYRRGAHRDKRNADGTFRHHITLNQNRAMENAAKTLLHELCHAIQSERYSNPDDFWAEYSAYNHSGRHYQSENPFEMEAVNFADDNFEQWADILY